jgi:regulator of protease activity HflC (stomatin/prohibitin superfamily)
MDITVYYKTDGSKIPALQVKYANQSAYDHGIWYPAYNLVENMARTAAYEEVARQDSLTIHQHRDEVANAMKDNIQKALNDNDPGVFTVTRVVMRQVVTDPAIEQSILRAVQVQKEIEAKKQEIDLAKAEAQRTVAEAQGTAQRNQILNASITQTLIDYKKALAMEECAASSKCTMVIGGGVPLINTK